MITIGTPTTGVGSSAGGDDYTLSHEVVAGTKVLVVGVAAVYSSGNGATSAKWNGTSMDTAAEYNEGSTAAIFYIRNPEVGTFNVAIHDDNGAGHAGSSPRIFAVNLSDQVIGTRIGATATGDSVDQTYVVQGTAGVVFDVFIGDTTATLDADHTSIWSNQAIGSDKTAASYITHSGSNVTTDHGADGDPTYAGAEFMEGTDFAAQILIV